jgi:hypothetical protein
MFMPFPHKLLGRARASPNRYTFDDYEPLELLDIAKRMAAGS